MTDLPDHFRCGHELMGKRCHAAGTVKPPGGKVWYCPAHCPELPRYVDGRLIAPPPGGFKALRDLVRQEITDLEADEERRAIQGET